MCEIIEGVKSVQVTKAVRDTNLDGNDIKTGDILGIVDGKIELVGKKNEDVLISSLDKIVDDDTGIITVFCGEEIAESGMDKLKAKLTKKYPECDVTVIYGKQPIYSYIASAE